MANTVGEDIEGCVVLIKKEILDSDYRDDEDRAYYVTGGFGADPTKISDGLFGFFVKDGIKAKLRGSHVDEVVSDSLKGYDGPVSRELVNKLKLLSRTHD